MATHQKGIVMSKQVFKLNHAGVNYGVESKVYRVDKNSPEGLVNLIIDSLDTSPFNPRQMEFESSVYSLVVMYSEQLAAASANDEDVVWIDPRTLSIDIVHRYVAKNNFVDYGSKRDDAAWLNAWNQHCREALPSIVVAYEYNLDHSND